MLPFSDHQEMQVPQDNPAQMETPEKEVAAATAQ